jgi:hypothetical protein
MQTLMSWRSKKRRQKWTLARLWSDSDKKQQWHFLTIVVVYPSKFRQKEQLLLDLSS